MPTGSERTHALALVLLASAAGCVLFEEPDIDERQKATPDLTEFAEGINAKLRMFAGCRDALASVVRESWERYSDQVDVGGKPKRKREGVYLRGVPDSTFRGCRRLLVNSRRIEPAMPGLEQITSNLVAAAEQYAAETRAAEQWLEDRATPASWGGLAEIDERLRAAHAHWVLADQALTEAIDARHLENDPVLLGVLEGRRSSLELDTRGLMIRARSMVRCMTADPIPAASACQAAFDEFDDAHTRFAERWAADRVASDKVFWMRTFAADAAEFHDHARSFQSDLARSKIGKGEVERLLDAHAGLARDFDTLDFDFP